MNSKKSLLAILIIFLIPRIAVAQAWDYLGERWSVNVGSDVAIGFSGSTRVLYVAANQDSLLKSSGSAIYWTNKPFAKPLFVACEVSNPNVVYVRSTVGATDKIWKSTNGGDSWSDISAGISNGVLTRLAISPLNTSILFLGGGALQGAFLLTTPTLFKSTTGGSNWTSVTTFGSDMSVTRIVPDPTNANVLFVAGTGSNDAVRLSPDGGNNWAAKNMGMDNKDISALAITPQNVNVLYAGTQGTLTRIYKTTNQGSSWTTVHTATNVTISDLRVDPSSSSVVYAGTSQGLLKSTNAGSSWTTINSGVYDVDVRSVAADPNTANLVYASTSSSFFYSTNGGSNWIDQANGSELVSSGGLAVLNGDVYSVTGKSTTIMALKYPYLSSSWQVLAKQASRTFTARDLAVDPSGHLLCAGQTDQSAIERSTDGGSSWTVVEEQPVDDPSVGFNTITIDPSLSSNMVCAAQRDRHIPTLNPELLYSSTNGASWSYPNTPPSDADYFATAYVKGTPGSASRVIFAAGGHPVAGGIIYNVGLISKSTDAGLTWSDYRAENQNIDFRALAIEDGATDFYAGFSGANTSIQGGVIRYTRDIGHLLNSPPSGSLHHVVSLARHPSIAGNLFMAEQSDVGVWKVWQTTDYGTTWTDFSSGLPFDVKINHLAFDQNGQSMYIYAGTERGVYRSFVQPYASSNSSVATAYGSTPKTLCSTVTGIWNAIYQDNGNLLHTYSTNDGASWSGRVPISGTLGGMQDVSDPSITEDAGGTLHAVFSSTGHGIYYVQKPVNGPWSSPVQIYGASQTSYPAFSVNGSGTADVAFVSYETQDGGGQGPMSPTYYYFLYHGTFSTSAPGVPGDLAVVTSSVNPITGTTLAVSGGQASIAWSRSGEIYYSQGSGSSWLSPENVSNNAGTSSNPCLINPSGNPTLVWQDNTPGNHDIFYEVRQSGSWTGFVNVSNNSSDSRYPFLSLMYSNFFVTWSDSSSPANGYDILYAYVGNTPHVLSSNPARQVYPSYSTRSIAGGVRLLTLWTEGSAAPYKINSSYLDNPIPKISAPATQNIAGDFRLDQNYPNPFNPKTAISFQLPFESQVSLKIYDVLGREVATLINEVRKAGLNRADWDAQGCASGVYYYRLVVQSQGKTSLASTRILVILR